MKQLILFFITFTSLGHFPHSDAQGGMPIAFWDQDGSIPRVFLIGQNETSYEKLMTDYSTMLLTVSDNDMNQAYGKWIDLLTQMEAFSKESNFDINGVKLWLNIFWNRDGSIQHIVYHPKPNSKNVATEDLSNFFSAFIEQYAHQIHADYKFSHYGSASFPTFPQRYKE